MALIIEDGTGKIDAQSYATDAELTAYAAERGITVAGTNGTNEQILLKAMSHIEGQSYIGYKKTREQALQWPRNDVELYGWDWPDDQIPSQMKSAQIETALQIDAGSDPTETTDPDVKSESVGSLSVTYMDHSSTKRPKIDLALAGLIKTGIEVVIL